MKEVCLRGRVGVSIGMTTHDGKLHVVRDDHVLEEFHITESVRVLIGTTTHAEMLCIVRGDHVIGRALSQRNDLRVDRDKNA